MAIEKLIVIILVLSVCIIGTGAILMLLASGVLFGVYTQPLFIGGIGIAIAGIIMFFSTLGSFKIKV